VLAMCDKLLILSNGMQQAFGPREDLLKKVTGPQTALEAPRSAASLRPTQIGNAG
jgi:ABC-type protease/lipase transport system fused ATPase/permease subunit